jgi:hypothetical protein
MGDSLFIMAGPTGWMHVEGAQAFDAINEGVLKAGIQMLEPTEERLKRFIDMAPLGHVFYLDVAGMLIICVGPDSARAAGVL